MACKWCGDRVAPGKEEGEAGKGVGSGGDDSVRCRMAAICEGAAACQPGAAAIPVLDLLGGTKA